jgi:hypothetical protein
MRGRRPKLATGGDHFVPRPPNEVIPTLLRFAQSTSPFQGEVSRYCAGFTSGSPPLAGRLLPVRNTAISRLF